MQTTSGKPQTIQRFGVVRTRPSHRPGFSLLELLIVVGIIAVIISIAVPTVTAVRRRSAAVQCLSNLRQISTNLLIWTNDHGERFPDPATEALAWEQLISPKGGGAVFRCPSDVELAPAVGSSYDWRDTGHPNSTLAGQNLSVVTRSSTVLVFESLPGWHQKDRVGVARFNAAVEFIPQSELMADLLEPVNHKGGS